MDSVKARALAAGLLLVLFMLCPVSAQEPARRVQASTRQPHMFYEPQAKYPPLGAIQAFREGLPTALGAALASLVLAMWLTRPLPEMERALHERQVKTSSQSQSFPGPLQACPEPSPSALSAATSDSLEPVDDLSAPAEMEEQPAFSEPPARPEALKPQPLPETEVPLPEPFAVIPGPPQAGSALVPPPPNESLRSLEKSCRARERVLAETLLRQPVAPSKRVRPPLDNPLLALSWSQVAPECLLPFREGESSRPGLLVYLVEPDRVGGFLAALAAELLLESTGSLILATVSVGPLEVVQTLLEVEPTTPPAEVLARLRREGRAIEQVVRRLYVPRPGGMALEDLLRRARDLREGGGGLAGVLFEPITRLEVGTGDLSSWLHRVHDGAALAGFPVFMVAARPGFPVESCPGQVLTLSEAEVARIIGHSRAEERSRGGAHAS